MNTRLEQITLDGYPLNLRPLPVYEVKVIHPYVMTPQSVSNKGLDVSNRLPPVPSKEAAERILAASKLNKLTWS